MKIGDFSFIIFLIFLSFVVVINTKEQFYVYSDLVPLYATKIHPYHNPSETYDFGKLPYPKKKKENSDLEEKLSDKIEGEVWYKTDHKIIFATNSTSTIWGYVRMDKKKIQAFQKAVQQEYVIEYELDGLPFKVLVGIEDKSKAFLFTHYDFILQYNHDQIISVKVELSRGSLYELTMKNPNKICEFTYSVHWYETTIPYKDRMSLYQQDDNQSKIRWISITSSLVVILLFSGSIAGIIWNGLKKDYRRYSKAKFDDLEDYKEEYGWKSIHGNIFRFPTKTFYLSSLLGVGIQFITLTFFICLFIGFDLYIPHREGTLVIYVLVIYALTSIISGYFSSKFYKFFNGRKWALNIILTNLLFSIPLLFIWLFLNIVSSAYKSTSAQTFGTSLKLFSIWFFIGIPLNFVGSFIGRRILVHFSLPCRVNQNIRQIPPQKWFQKVKFLFFISGILPFSLIHLEVYYIYSSVWGNQIFELYFVLFLAFILMITIVVTTTLALIYYQLCLENYKWWWNSFFIGGSVSIQFFFYSIYYWNYQSEMSGFLQLSYFFGYSLIAAYIIFIMFGTIGFLFSFYFIRKIYSNLKID
ncbi:transmembrane 9 superfamily member [Anaeramoeba flamelloides]|uniref:Transmembrane 9 superfamily member n=1 Tax=Anaeramoeba flamelloides TaxID=1746091 RepID=A0AAV7YCK9_9EUKA|nr:transmembrane 9 superfamily member [Anaeramoeba flamelloides]